MVPAVMWTRPIGLIEQARKMCVNDSLSGFWMLPVGLIALGERFI